MHCLHLKILNLKITDDGKDMVWKHCSDVNYNTAIWISIKEITAEFDVGALMWVLKRYLACLFEPERLHLKFALLQKNLTIKFNTIINLIIINGILTKIIYKYYNIEYKQIIFFFSFSKLWVPYFCTYQQNNNKCVLYKLKEIAIPWLTFHIIVFLLL